METLNWMLFESFPALAAVLFVVLFILLVRWRGGGSARPFLVGLGVSLLLVVINVTVMTQREHADRIMRDVEQGLLASDPAPLVAALGANFTSEQMDMDAFAEFAETQMRRVQVHRLYRLETRLESSSAEQFTIRFVYLSEVETRSNRATFNSAWMITFGAGDDGYQITDIRPIRIGPYDMENWNDVRTLR